MPQASGRFRGDGRVAGPGPGEPESEQKRSDILTSRLLPAPQKRGAGCPPGCGRAPLVPGPGWASWERVPRFRGQAAATCPVSRTPQDGVPGAGCRRQPRCGGVCRTCCRAPSWPASGAFRRQTAPRTSSPCLPAEQTDRAHGGRRVSVWTARTDPRGRAPWRSHQRYLIGLGHPSVGQRLQLCGGRCRQDAAAGTQRSATRLGLVGSAGRVEAPGSARHRDGRTGRQPRGDQGDQGRGGRLIWPWPRGLGSGDKQAGRKGAPGCGAPGGRGGFVRQEGAAGGGQGRDGAAGARGPARPRGRHSPLQGGQLEALGAELDEGPQVRLAHAAYGVDVGAGAVVLGQVAEEAGGKGNTGVPCGGPEGCRPRQRGGDAGRGGGRQ